MKREEGEKEEKVERKIDGWRWVNVEVHGGDIVRGRRKHEKDGRKKG